MKRLFTPVVLAASLLIAACSSDGSADAGGSTGGTGGTSGGACVASLPFGGDICQSLVASDFAVYDYALDKTELLAGDNGQKDTQCLYDVSDQRGAGGTAQPAVSYGSECDWDVTQQSEENSTDEYETLSGLGDAAFSFYAFGSLVIFVKYKGYIIEVSQGGYHPEDASFTPVDSAEVMTSLTEAVLGRL